MGVDCRHDRGSAFGRQNPRTIARGFRLPRRPTSETHSRSRQVSRSGTKFASPADAILVDMNVTHRWASHPAAAGHTTIHWSDVGSMRAKDGEIGDYARDHKSVLLTNALDFPHILAHTKEAKALRNSYARRAARTVRFAGLPCSAQSRPVRLRSMTAQSLLRGPLTRTRSSFAISPWKRQLASAERFQ
jgi:hypothetical protein